MPDPTDRIPDPDFNSNDMRLSDAPIVQVETSGIQLQIGGRFELFYLHLNETLDMPTARDETVIEVLAVEGDIVTLGVTRQRREPEGLNSDV